MRRVKRQYPVTVEFVKIVFPLLVDDDGFPPISSESLNARKTKSGSIIENTPFFVTGIALGDCVQGKPIPGQPDKFVFDGVLEASEN